MSSARLRPAALAGFFVPVVLLFSSLLPPTAASQPMPGDVVTVTTLAANFDGDTPSQPPNLALPGDPAGDFLTLDTSAGTVLVVPSYDGLSMPVEIRQVNTVGSVMLVGHAVPTPVPPQLATARWRSVAKDDEAISGVGFVVRASNGAILASIEYLHQGGLTYNGSAGAAQVLPVMRTNRVAQAYTIEADFQTRTTSLTIDGVAVPGFGAVPFPQNGDDVATVEIGGQGSHPQTLYADDISVVARYVVPDRAPTISAPASVSGTEGAALSFPVTASDPDGQAIAALAASPLPPGAAFTPNAANTGGTFAWTPDFTQAGSYSVTFTASNALSGSATTAITVSNTDRVPAVTAPAVVDGEEGGVVMFAVSATDPDGEAIGTLDADLGGLPAGNAATFTPDAGSPSGTFRWPMARGEAGTYVVAFSASNGGTGTASTRINVAFSGTTLTGQLIWTPQPGDEGTYTVTFTAVNNLGEPGSATTTLVVGSAAGSVSSALQAASPASAAADATLAPQAPLKGPIVRAAGLQDATIGETTVVSATAEDAGGLLARSITRTRTVAGAPGAATGIVTFEADMSGLPPGNDATFVVDEEPAVTAPLSRTVDPGVPLSFAVAAGDPDGDPLLGLDADLSQLPSGHTATFTKNASFTSGTFAWTPRGADAGTFVVTFTGFNRLVGTAATTITVRPVAPAEIFLAGPKKFRLSSNRPFGCVQIEPVDESFSLFDVDLATIRMVSVGTGIVSEIPVGSTKEAVIGDRDNDLIPDMQVCFDRDQLRSLFSLLRGNQIVPVIVRGQLVTGSLFEGSLLLDIVAGGGPLNAVLAPNPLNPAGTLSFLTKTPGRVRVSVYDAQGRFVRTIWEDRSAPAGAHEIGLDGRGADRRPLPSGVYFYRIESEDGASSGRFTVLK